jgi:hypothetical protein
MSGKGSAPRPFSVTQEQFIENFDRIFGPKKSTDTPETEVNNIDININIEDELSDVGNGAGLG